MEKKKASFAAVCILSLAALYFFYEFFLRVILGTIASELMQDLHIGAEQFALIGSAYYVTYGIMQTPVGILIDRYGTRTLLTLACLICNIGVIGFAFSDGFTLALLSRFLIGFGSSFAFVSILVIALNWFPREHFAFLTGVVQFLGSVGPFLGGAPLAYLISSMGNNWRLVLIWIAAFGFILNIFLALFIRTRPKGSKQKLIFLTKSEPLSKKLLTLIQNRQVWWIIFYAGFVYVTLPILGAFWGTSYLKSRGFNREIAAFIISMIWIGLAVGCPLIGKLSDSLKRRKPLLMASALLGLFVASYILYTSSNSKIFLSFLFFLLGLASSGQSISFATISEHVPRKLHATAIGLNNSMITFFGSIFPPIVSLLIQSASPPGAKEFTEQAFEYGFSLMPLFYLGAFILAFIGVKETYCRQQHEVFPLEKK